MPSIVGHIKILSVGLSSIVQFGDAVQLTPESTSKTFAGAGSFNSGDTVHTDNKMNSTVTNDMNDVDFSSREVGN